MSFLFQLLKDQLNPNRCISLSIQFKTDFGMARSYLKRFVGDEINVMMAASAFNFRRWLRKVKLLPDWGNLYANENQLYQFYNGKIGIYQTNRSLTNMQLWGKGQQMKFKITF